MRLLSMSPLCSRSSLIVALAISTATLGSAQTLRICSDSTTANYDVDNAKGLQGWGYFIGNYLDVLVDNQAKNGRSTRSFINEGLWDELLNVTSPGDYILIEHGHNDDSKDPSEKDRGVLPGIGDESAEYELTLTQGTEVVHTFGWYLRKMITDVQAAKAIPILSGMVPRNYWKGETLRSQWDFRDWTEQVAKQTGVAFVDHTAYSVKRFQAMGFEESRKYYPNDRTHTNPDGAKLNAETLVQAVKCGKVAPLDAHLNAAGQAVTNPSCI